MTIDQLLYVAARIHDPEKSANDNVCRAMEIVLQCEQAIEAQAEVENMKARGSSLTEMLRPGGIKA
jgi:hypothetical protein